MRWVDNTAQDRSPGAPTDRHCSYHARDRIIRVKAAGIASAQPWRNSRTTRRIILQAARIGCSDYSVCRAVPDQRNVAAEAVVVNIWWQLIWR